MGVWGAAQAGAFAIGGFLGAVGVGALRGVFHQPGPAFLLVFCIEALVFLISALLAGGLNAPQGSKQALDMVGRPAGAQLGGTPG